MNNFLDKVEGMMATILDMMDVETADASEPIVDEELVRENEIGSDAHHKLIELCW